MKQMLLQFVARGSEWAVRSDGQTHEDSAVLAFYDLTAAARHFVEDVEREVSTRLGVDVRGL